MTSTVTGQQLANQALTYASKVTKNLFGKITKVETVPANHPYSEKPSAPDSFDCQSWIEYLFEELGIKVQYKGTNDMWRNWGVDKGTIAEGVAKYGSIPIGALIEICDFTKIPSGYTNPPDADHIYIKVAPGWLMHCSQTNGGVSAKAFSDKAINGGPTHYLLPKHATYSGISTDTSDESDSTDTMTDDKIPVDVSEFYTIRLNCLGGAVERLQAWLVKLGYKLRVDHEFGPATKAAVVDFQTKNGLKPDGIVGQKTWEALARAILDASTEANA